jgi:hypothetical protein
MSDRRSCSFNPPQMPCGSRISRANSRHDCLTPQPEQIDLALLSRRSRSSLRSKCDGGKNIVDCGPLQAARNCHISSTALIMTTPPGGDFEEKVTKIHQKDKKKSELRHMFRVEGSFPSLECLAAFATSSTLRV